MHANPRIPDPTRSDSPVTPGWNAAEIAALILEQTDREGMPAFLFLGRHEQALLREHLGAAFGHEAVTSLRDSYYMGLEIIEVASDYFLRVGGRKRLPARPARLPSRYDRPTVWRFEIG